ncbi:MAG: squalene/phytoene synthase family protein [Planctomycetota bacterium]
MVSLDELLRTTSRTFALAIPLLPSEERLDVTLGYLVFRIADTLEDADTLPRDERIAGLEAYRDTLADLTPAAARRFVRQWADRRPTHNQHYQRLLEHTPDVLAALAGRPPEARRIIVGHSQRSIAGMAGTLRGADAAGVLRCTTVEQLREYCYHVAGIVGELLTDLFQLRLGETAGGHGRSLSRDARWFGEGLQLVNILKDAAADADAGRTYLPAGVPLEDIFAIAHDDLTRAARYIDTLREHGAPAGYIAFTRAPREMAVATLARLRTDGPGAKLTRPEVAAILRGIQQEFTPVAGSAGAGAAGAGASTSEVGGA